MSRSSAEKRLKRWKRVDQGPVMCSGTTGASYLRAMETALGIQAGSASVPSGPRRARRPAGKMTRARSASMASRVSCRVRRVRSRVRFASTHSTGISTSSKPAATRWASELA